MGINTEEIVNILIRNISVIDEVEAIGISGNKEQFPIAGEGDIDIFIYGNTIPDIQIRQDVMNKMKDLLEEGKTNVFEEGHWGIGDFVVINGVETWLMYFTVDEALNEVESILKGDYPDKVDNYYYPVGRCAMLRDIGAKYDKNGFLSSIKKRLSNYPESLAKTIIEYHLDELEDKEDLERAVSRKDVLFYHFALDIAIDHYLQALFALNGTFFASRKRTLSFIEKFNIKPKRCDERLLEVVKLGSDPDSINQSYLLLIDMIDELKGLYKS